MSVISQKRQLAVSPQSKAAIRAHHPDSQDNAQLFGILELLY